MVLGGKVRAAVRMVTNRGTGGAYRPFNLDSKSGCPIIEVLREKHPASRVPSHVRAPDCLDSMPVYCFEECVAKAAACLSGSAGPCGVDAEMLKNWLLRHGWRPLWVPPRCHGNVGGLAHQWVAPLCCLPSEAAPCPLQPCYFAKWDILANTSDYQYVMGFPVCICNHFLPIFPISCHLLMLE